MMQKKLLLLTLALFGFFGLQAQLVADTTRSISPNAVPIDGFDYGNDWYDGAMPWVKIKVVEDGIYRITALDLQNAQVSLGTIDPNTIHIYYRNKEQPIYVKQTGGQILDYLEFYGVHNDGKVDSIMYRDPDPVTGRGLHKSNLSPNENVSIFSDTSVYFMTWDNVPGRRITEYSNTNYSNFTPEPHYRHRAYFEFHPRLNASTYNLGGGTRYDPYYLLNCDYITGEGYMHKSTFNNGPNGGSSQFINLSTRHAANNGPHEFRARVYSRSTQVHIVEMRIQNNNQSNSQTIVYDTTYGVNIKTHSGQTNFTLPNNTRFRFFAHGTQNNFTDNNNICWGWLKYDHTPNFNSQSQDMIHDWNRNTDAFFAFDNVDITDKAWLWDMKTLTRIEGNKASNDSLYVIVPGSNLERDILVCTDNGLRTPVAIEANPDFGNLSDPSNGGEFVIITHRSLASSAIAYKNYRDTCTVNMLDSKIVFVDQIYDEFGYGSPTPWAIKRFCKFATDRWNVKPRYFLLWGKGRYKIRNSPLNLVPTYGYPACDNEYVSNYDPEAINLTPEVPIGRVNIYNNGEGMIYLEKVMEYEHTAWQPWMKEMVMFGGGEDTLEQRPILNYLLNYKSRYEAAPFGGRAWYYQKFNSTIRSNSTLLSSAERINNGVGIIHFFGHSSNNIFDIDIQLPSLYNNFGRYPLMVAYGCYGGDFTGPDKSFGEKFILEPGRGSIGYLANSTAGYLNPLGHYGEQLYPSFFRDHVGEPIGNQLQATVAGFSNLYPQQLHNNHAKQLNLQGDPSVTLYYTPFPDLEITQSSIFLEPETYSASEDSFWVNIVCRNLGLVTNDSFYVSIRQETPSGNVLVHPSLKRARITYEDTIRYKIYNTEGNAMAGINYFDIFVDSTNIIAEGNEANNRVNYQAVIPGDVPAILHPFEYAVIDSVNTYLAASAYIISQQPNVDYIFEIDTLPEFNSPRLTSSGSVSGSPNYTRWDVPFNFEPNQVYYWRVRLANIQPVAWATSSFKYLPGKQGWGQSEPPQFFKDNTEKIHMDEIQREWEFDKVISQLSVFNVSGSSEMAYRLAGFRSKRPGDYNQRDGIHYTVIDKNTLEPYIFGNAVMGDWTYTPTPSNTQQLVTDIANAQTGDYVLICPVRMHNMQNWAPNAIQALYQIGCSPNISTLSGNDLFIIVGRKGYPGSAIEVLSPNVAVGSGGVNNQYDLNVNLEGNEGEGDVQSTIIGPSVGWEELIWDWSSQDPFTNENTTLNVYALRADNSDSLILQGLEKGTHDLRFLDHDRFPKMRIEAKKSDKVNYTAPQLDNWYVLYTPAPDAIADPLALFEFLPDTVDEGASVTVSLAAVNVTDPNMDSLLVRYAVRRTDRSVAEVGLERYAPLPGQDRIDVSHTFSTGNLNLGGDATLQIELNPNDDQAEQYLFNNLYQYKFHVREDVINPIMDVTFDGKHIMDWDIVSPNPEILIEINDENPYLKVNDTAYTLYFGEGGLGDNLQLIHLGGNPLIERVPADLPDNRAQIFFRPENLEDGDYTLRVMGYDHKGNPSGDVEYEIHFKVVNESAVSNILNYPNPFSTSTEFVYTLTGSDIPDQFRIDIYTITGRLVKSIDLAETGDVKIGYTRTEYKWDGRDDFGDLLANGVYIYKVTVKAGGKNLKIRDEGLSPYFKNGIGKMYIMR